MLVQNPIAAWFQSALAAVSQQIYPNWELIMAGDLSSAPESLGIAAAFRKNDARIKFVPTPAGADQTAIFGKALANVLGDYLARLDQHDQLPPHALFHLAQIIAQQPDVQFIYTDHDEIDAAGNRSNPCFKPDWNPDYFLSHHYLGNLCVYRTQAVRELNGYRTGFEPAEDYDLKLRYLKNIPAVNIQHISRVLYHQRISSLSATLSNAVSAYRTVHQSGKLALADFLSATGARLRTAQSPGFTGCIIHYRPSLRWSVLSYLAGTNANCSKPVLKVSSIKQTIPIGNY